MKGIEDKIRNNQEAFNRSEPSPGHLKKFNEKLDAFHNSSQENWFERNGIILRIAATVLFFVALGTFYYSSLFEHFKESVSHRIVAAELPDELQEIMLYYNAVTSKKVDQIDQLAVSQNEASRIREKAMTELRALEEHRVELEKEYMSNPNNERIRNALVRNQQKKSEILDLIINALNQVN